MTPGGAATSFQRHFGGEMGPKRGNGAVRAHPERSITYAEGSSRVGHAKKEHAARSAAPKKEKNAPEARLGV